MTNKLLSPFAVVAIVFVGLAFAAVAFAVFVTRGKSKFWIDKKMRTGGVLLTLSAMISSGAGCGLCQPTCYEPAEPTCYDVVAVNQVRIEQDSVSLKDGNLSGEMYDSTSDEYAFMVLKDKDTVQKGNFKLQPLDTSSYSRKFTIEFDKKLSPDLYRLIISNTDGYDLSVYDIKITE
ncbi:MAG: hypothetical protein II956_03400 [Bacteroidales bacterium]|nr:hypothetical protein [Bacteroidales bacterium]